MEANSKKKGTLSQLLDYTGNFRGLTYLGLFLSAVAMIMGMNSLYSWIYIPSHSPKT